ncbi:MAG: VWA domain-containing protein [Gammaproteobacteria bacterium]
MRRRQRNIEFISVSFLDVITCGFGALVLLLALTPIGVRPVFEPLPTELTGTVAKLEDELFRIRGTVKVLNRDLNARREQVSRYRDEVARLEHELRDNERRAASAAQDAAAQSAIIEQMKLARQSLTEEMKRLLAQKNRPRNDLVGGIPVDSEYVIFVIDTSGSMFQYAWGRMIQVMIQTLNIYPALKGIQVMSDQGAYMFPQYRGQWIPDTPARRRAIVDRLQGWNPFSASSPVRGIEEAIRTFYSPDKKISIYVLGDEFAPGPSIDQAVRMINLLNRRDRDGGRRVRIHAVGFPTQLANPPHLQGTGIRFAQLMRQVCHDNGGTFVALNDFQ